MPTYQMVDSTTDSVTLKLVGPGAVIVYGRGGDLGSFAVFARTLKKDLCTRYGENVMMKSIERKTEFLQFLSDTDFGYPVQELHIFSHAFGTGLALGYQDADLSRRRQDFVERELDAYYTKNRLDELYDRIIQLEEGIVFVDDLLDASSSMKTSVQSKFTAERALVKLWGCRSAHAAWEYDYNSPYWGALNYKRNPKPSIAQTVATFCGVVTYGAKSGSHIEVRDGSKWVTSDTYKSKYGRPASGQLPHRLEPDSGGFIAHNP